MDRALRAKDSRAHDGVVGQVEEVGGGGEEESFRQSFGGPIEMPGSPDGQSFRTGEGVEDCELPAGIDRRIAHRGTDVRGYSDTRGRDGAIEVVEHRARPGVALQVSTHGFTATGAVATQPDREVPEARHIERGVPEAAVPGERERADPAAEAASEIVEGAGRIRCGVQ